MLTKQQQGSHLGLINLKLCCRPPAFQQLGGTGKPLPSVPYSPRTVQAMPRASCDSGPATPSAPNPLRPGTQQGHRALNDKGQRLASTAEELPICPVLQNRNNQGLKQFCAGRRSQAFSKTKLKQTPIPSHNTSLQLALHSPNSKVIKLLPIQAHQPPPPTHRGRTRQTSPSSSLHVLICQNQALKGKNQKCHHLHHGQNWYLPCGWIITWHQYHAFQFYHCTVCIRMFLFTKTKHTNRSTQSRIRAPHFLSKTSLKTRARFRSTTQFTMISSAVPKFQLSVYVVLFSFFKNFQNSIWYYFKQDILIVFCLFITFSVSYFSHKIFKKCIFSIQSLIFPILAVFASIIQQFDFSAEFCSWQHSSCVLCIWTVHTCSSTMHLNIFLK